MTLQSAIRFLYPPQCLSCRAETEADFALCGSCWKDTPFISGLVCDACGMPLPGEDANPDILCDSCLIAPKPWTRGRAVFLYAGRGRSLVLGLKHGDRQDLVRPLAGWMARIAKPVTDNTSVIAPVPLHWRRLFRRRYNQAALLSTALAEKLAIGHCPDLLIRHRATRIQDGMSRTQRFDNLFNALKVNRKHLELVEDRKVLLIDDVMTTGATLSACTEVLLQAGAISVNVLVLARVAKDA